MARRRSRLGPSSGSIFMASGRGGRRRRRGRRSAVGPRRRRGGGGRLLGLAALAATVVAGVAYGLPRLRDDGGRDDRQAAAQRFARAWAARDPAAMWRSLDGPSRRARSATSLARAYARAERSAGVRTVRVGAPSEERDGAIAVRVIARTARFGTLRATVPLPVAGVGAEAGVAWRPELRLPGLRAGETPSVREGRQPRRGSVRAADGSRLDADPLGASIVGRPASGERRATGLQRVHDARLAGAPSARLRFGRRTIASVEAVPGRSVITTIRPGLQRRAAVALGDRLGGVAVIRPADGAVQALAGLAVSAPQPPGSVFKIVTLAAALKAGIATPQTQFPVRSFAVLSGTRLRNANDEQCGGSLVASFAESCNSVFGPLGARLGTRRLVGMAEGFGFNEANPRIPALKRSTVATEARDALALGATAIGQERDLATPLQMADVAATIAAAGRRTRPRLTTVDPLVRRRVVSARVAGQVRDMMVGVVAGGTGRAAALPGTEVAGKTGTAELTSTADGPANPANTNAWFVAFAPASAPQVAVAVLVVGGGAGGATAAPIAREVLRAALG